MRALLGTVLAFALLSPIAASAQDAPPAREVVFVDDEQVRGDRTQSDVENLVVPRIGPRSSLIRIRSQFVDAIVDSARDL